MYSELTLFIAAIVVTVQLCVISIAIYLQSDYLVFDRWKTAKRYYERHQNLIPEGRAAPYPAVRRIVHVVRVLQHLNLLIYVLVLIWSIIIIIAVSGYILGDLYHPAPKSHKFYNDESETRQRNHPKLDGLSPKFYKRKWLTFDKETSDV